MVTIFSRVLPEYVEVTRGSVALVISSGISGTWEWKVSKNLRIIDPLF